MALNCAPLPSSEMIRALNSLRTFDEGASVNQQAVTCMLQAKHSSVPPSGDDSISVLIIQKEIVPNLNDLFAPDPKRMCAKT